MKTLKICIGFTLIALATALPIALVWTITNPGDFRTIPRFVNGGISLLAVPFQVGFAFLRIDNIHNIGIPAKTMGVASLELIIILSFQLLRLNEKGRKGSS
jgi:hypothetical protein